MQVSFTSSPTAAWNRMAEVTKLLFKSARVSIGFTREGWRQLLQCSASPVSAFVQSINIKANLALYITAHEEQGIFLDIECQELCYQSGLFLIIRKEHGVWYITDVFTTGEDTGYEPVYFWTRVKRGCKLAASRVLILDANLYEWPTLVTAFIPAATVSAEAAADVQNVPTAEELFTEDGNAE